ncbi:alpha/beta fold hydrolase [Planomicrobium sp. CPCC 101079]|uniref:alpha/beta fold hydrolase n=1 Tax=Planomicrobium sp. CPCC 101079 TaxID=2599618 RepID=UPI0011B4D12C|nr:alpha/beta hydrolase [Planomicrobium sp. CPCC 101079]TWT14327.1 alpha/beta hydrolase [Planomicrobium sp. CPCC 101079]
MYRNPYENLSEPIRIAEIAKAGFNEKRFWTGRIQLNFVEGPDNGPALVLIPAQMGIWESYQKVMVPLSKKFHVFVVEIRGHGKSSWTPGDYSWKSIGADMESFLKGVVGKRAILTGNSSGGIIALWCGAHVPEYVAGIVLEDAPIFSAEMPRFKDWDRFVYNGLHHLVEKIGDPLNRDIADYFRGLEMPVSDTRTKKVPEFFIRYLSKKTEKFEAEHPGRPVDVGFPETLRLLLKSLSMFDPDFSRAFLDGRFYEGMDHEESLRSVKCPMLVLHANWRRFLQYGLVGAMDDDDAKRLLNIVPHAVYKKIPANHVIHMFKPKEFVKAITAFSEEAGL